MLARVRTRKAVGAGLDEALKPIPACLRDFSKLIGNIQNQIENDQGKIAIAQKEIGGFHGVERLRATNPKQVAQARVTKRFRIE